MLRRLLSQLPGRRDWRDDLSAYLDGELTPRQRARVEARLARSAEQRAYLDDLRKMRAVLRRFAAEPPRPVFQITPAMLSAAAPTELRPSALDRALRVSVATAAAGVATFSAVLIFDVVDRPSVAFTQTAAGLDGSYDTAAPTALVVAEPAEQQSAAVDETESAAESAVSAVSMQSAQSAQQEQAAQQAQWFAEEEEAAAWDEAEAEQVEPAEPQAADEPVEQQAEQQQAMQQQAAPQDYEQAARDPARHALTAGQGGADDDQAQISASDVVAVQAEAPPAETDDASEAPLPDEASTQAEPPAPTEQSAQTAQTAQTAQAESVAAASSSPPPTQTAVAAAEPAAPAQPSSAQPQAQAVTASVRPIETEWPLEQRPQTGRVRVAVDPSWELPVQIVLAVIALGATFSWLLLTLIDRRRPL